MRRVWRFIRKRGFVTTLTPTLGFFALKLLRRTLRITHQNQHHLEACLRQGRPVICAFWHGRMLMMPFAHPSTSLRAGLRASPGRQVAVLISHHRDGESIGRIVKRFGFFLIRGSATRGGAEALRRMVTALQQGFHVAITPDGPRGPRGQTKIGVIKLAKLTGCPILPVAFSASSRLFLNSWDAFLIPLPFSRGVYVWGEPLSVKPDADEAEMAKQRQVLEERLNALTMEADTFFDRKRSAISFQPSADSTSDLMKKQPDTRRQTPDTYQRRQSGSQPDCPVHWPLATGYYLSRVWFAPLWAYSLRLIAGKGEDAFAKVWLGFLEGLSRLYGAAVKLQASLRLSSPRRLPCPVISIGNIAVGGTGKTSFVEMLAKRLLDRGMKPLVLLRGYRGKAKVPLVVSDGVDILARPPLAGDEAYLLATKLPGVPVVTGADRYLAGSLAFSHFHPDVFLLDDGFQHRKLHRDLDIVLLDGRNPFGYGYLLPRGLLREPPEALKRAHLVAITTDEPFDSAQGRPFDFPFDFAQGRAQGFEKLLASLRLYHPKTPIILRRLPRAFLALSEGREACDELRRVVGLSALKGKKALAFSGIGNPASFEAQLRRLGVEVLEHRVFLDHHRYRPEDLVALAEAAERRGAEVLLTTEKDMVRMPFWPYAIPLFALRIELEVIEGEEELEQALESAAYKVQSSKCKGQRAGFKP